MVWNSRCHALEKQQMNLTLWVNMGSPILPYQYRPLTRYAKLRVAHALGMPGTFSPPPRVSDLGMHPSTCVTHVPGCMPESLASGFLWSRWGGKRSRHSRRMRNPHFNISVKRPIELVFRISKTIKKNTFQVFMVWYIFYMWRINANLMIWN